MTARILLHGREVFFILTVHFLKRMLNKSTHLLILLYLKLTIFSYSNQKQEMFCQFVDVVKLQMMLLLTRDFKGRHLNKADLFSTE